MRPKGKLFALFAVFAAIGLVTASGAFTTVEAERTADVNVAGDDAALLQISPGTNDNADAYVQNNSGQTEISLVGGFDNNNNNPDGQGVNIDATTTVDGVITITNQGSQDAGIHITRSGDNPTAVNFVNSTDADDIGSENITGSGNSVTVSPGDSITISMIVETDDTFGPDDELINQITIVADANDT